MPWLNIESYLVLTPGGEVVAEDLKFCSGIWNCKVFFFSETFVNLFVYFIRDRREIPGILEHHTL